MGSELGDEVLYEGK